MDYLPLQKLAQTGKTDEAIAFLKDGISKLPIESLSGLYPKTAELLAGIENVAGAEREDFGKEGIASFRVTPKVRFWM